jgi:hypothetical protein
MPMLADIDDPPRSRLPGMVFGLLVALPIVAIIAGWFIPMAVGTILSGARDLDERLRANDAYMRQLCATSYLEERDAELCNCVWAMEIPSLDCRPQWNMWAVQVESAVCQDPTSRDAALSYCTCIDTVAEKVAAAEDPHLEAAAFERCEQLPDALPMPALAEPEAE